MKSADIQKLHAAGLLTGELRLNSIMLRKHIYE